VKARNVILQYLQNHDSFTSSELAEKFGLKRNTIAHAALQLFDAGELHIKVRRRSGIVYQLPGEEEPMSLAGEFEESPLSNNTIFAECRNSPNMQRLLFVYGRREGISL